MNAGHLASGMWQALITTATGLALSAVALLAHHFILGRIRVLTHEMEWLGQELLVSFTRIKASKEIELEEMDEATDAGSGERAS